MISMDFDRLIDLPPSFNKSTNAAVTQCSTCTNEELPILVLSIDVHYVTFVTYCDIRTIVFTELIPNEFF